MSEQDAIERLRDAGFILDFTPVMGALKITQTGELVAPEQARIREIHRFEGATDLSDEAIVYGIETSGGARGVLVDAYGPYASPELASFIDRIPTDRGYLKPGDRPVKPY